jgi:AcrR family transcriptional regulator
MGRRGWAGSPPVDDDEARRLIVDAAIRCVETYGAERTTLSDVATELGVIRKTVYRYYATTEELFTAVSEVAMEGFVARLERATSHIVDPHDLLVESLAYCVEKLPDEPLLMLLLVSGHTSAFNRQILAPRSIERSRTILLQRRVDWAALGYDNRTLDELVEYLLRIIQSMILTPPDPPRRGKALRTYLRRWVGPSLRMESARA